jgi:large subunit ribosomal protein L10
MNKNQKSELVSTIRTKLVNNPFIVIIHYRGMTDKQMYDMRVLLKQKDCNIKVAKNTLVKVALKDTELESLLPYLNGPTALVYSQDIVSLSKVLSEVSKQVQSLEIKVGYFNKSIISEIAIKEMAKLGSLNEVRSSFISIINGAQSNFVRLLSAYEKTLKTSNQ